MKARQEGYVGDSCITDHAGAILEFSECDGFDLQLTNVFADGQLVQSLQITASEVKLQKRAVAAAGADMVQLRIDGYNKTKWKN